MAAALQYGATAFIAGLQATRARSNRVADLRSDATSEPGNVISFILFNRPVPGKDQVYPE
jgi:hypothetical protein